MALKKLCRCGKPILLTVKHCQACTGIEKQRESERQRAYTSNIRDKRSTGFYNSPAWKRARISALQRDLGLCVMCRLKGKIKHAALVHHIVTIKEDWSKRLDLKNLQSLCEACHQYAHRNDGKTKHKNLTHETKVV